MRIYELLYQKLTRPFLLCLIIISHGLFLRISLFNPVQMLSKISEDGRIVLLIISEHKTFNSEKLTIVGRNKRKKTQNNRLHQFSSRSPLLSGLEIYAPQTVDASEQIKSEFPPNIDRVAFAASFVRENAMPSQKSQGQWQQFSTAVEKTAKRSGSVDETFSLPDGSRITKHNGRCYKSPDPGREYLRQPEIREVFCPK